MSNTRTYAFVVLALAGVLAAAPQAQADRGRITLQNCEDKTLYVCLYDWNDSWTDRELPRMRMAISPGALASGSCRLNWKKENAPGCWIRFSFDDSLCGAKRTRPGTDSGTNVSHQSNP